MCMHRLIIVKMFVLLNLIYRFNIILIKIPASYFVGSNKWFLKFIGKRPKIVQTILKEKNKARGPTLPNFKT